jgi:hypothetical protein
MEKRRAGLGTPVLRLMLNLRFAKASAAETMMGSGWQELPGEMQCRGAGCCC